MEAVDLGHRPRPPAGVGVVGVVGALPVARGPGGVVPGPGVPAGRVGGVVVDEDSRGVGQGKAHDPHRSSSDRLVSGRAMTVQHDLPGHVGKDRSDSLQPSAGSEL